MAAKKRAAPMEASRLAVLAAGDVERFVEVVAETLRSGDRLSREAALDALVEHPVADARDAARALFFSLHGNGPKLDQAARLRIRILRYLVELSDARDGDVGGAASACFEQLLGDDVTYELRTLGLRLLANIDDPLLLYYAVEHLDDVNLHDGEPSSTALQVVADKHGFAILYGWLRASGAASPNLIRAFELFTDAPRAIVARFVQGAIADAVGRGDEPLCIALAEAIVKLELADGYSEIDSMMKAKVSDDLYHYLAVLLAATNRAPLLTILEEQLHGGRRPRIIEEALHVRTTPEQAAILQRWEDGDY